jgi:hypothetical protein
VGNKEGRNGTLGSPILEGSKFKGRLGVLGVWMMASCGILPCQRVKGDIVCSVLRPGLVGNRANHPHRHTF